MKDFIIKVEGMKCSGCEKRVVNVLGTLPTVINVIANYKTGEVIITAEKIDEKLLKEKIENLGFKVI